MSIRADESIHRDVNHRFAEIANKDEIDCQKEVESILDKDYRIEKTVHSNVTS
jgi:hypothetical protein